MKASEACPRGLRGRRQLTSSGRTGVRVFCNEGEHRVTPIPAVLKAWEPIQPFPEARTRVKRLLALVEPALILSMVLAAGFVIVPLLLPILNLYEIQL
jgi:hypothetical protein